MYCIIQEAHQPAYLDIVGKWQIWQYYCSALHSSRIEQTVPFKSWKEGVNIQMWQPDILSKWLIKIVFSTQKQSYKKKENLLWARN